MAGTHIEAPEFNVIYAVLVLSFILCCISLFKPKYNYIYLHLTQFHGDTKKFCLARIKYWTVRYIFNYAKPLVAITLYIITIVLITIIGVTRVKFDFLNAVRDIKHVPDNFCGEEDLAHQMQDVLQSTHTWSDQLTWLLTAYFFQKMFGATLLVNGGVNSIMIAIVFDPWLFALTIWATVLAAKVDTFAFSSAIQNCHSHDTYTDSIFEHINDVVWALAIISTCLWIMVALSLSVSLVLEWLFTSIREFQYCFKPKYWRKYDRIRYERQMRVIKEMKEEEKNKLMLGITDDDVEDEPIANILQNEMKEMEAMKMNTVTSFLVSSDRTDTKDSDTAAGLENFVNGALSELLEMEDVDSIEIISTGREVIGNEESV